MAEITLEQATTQRDAWLAADMAVSMRQSYTLGRLTLTSADAAEITKKLNYWENMVTRLSTSGGSMRSRLAVPLDF